MSIKLFYQVINKQQIKFVRSLRQRKMRDESGMFIAEGLKSVNEAIECFAESIEVIYISSNNRNNDKLKHIPDNIAIIEISENDFLKISSFKTPQGFLALIRKPEDIIPKVETLNDLTIVLDNVNDPGNLGTIIRLADWLGINQIICSRDTVDCYNPKVVQASMGAVLRIGVHYTDLSEFVNKIKVQTKLHVYSTSLNGENLYQTKLSQPAVLIFGNEANGISKEILNLVDKSLLVPSYSNNSESSESLNVSIAAAIVLSEFRRQFSGFHSK